MSIQTIQELTAKYAPVFEQLDTIEFGSNMYARPSSELSKVVGKLKEAVTDLFIEEVKRKAPIEL